MALYGLAQCTDRCNVRADAMYGQGAMHGQMQCTDRRNVRTGRDLSVLRNIINENIKNHIITQSNIKITFKILQN